MFQGIEFSSVAFSNLSIPLAVSLHCARIKNTSAVLTYEDKQKKHGGVDDLDTPETIYIIGKHTDDIVCGCRMYPVDAESFWALKRKDKLANLFPRTYKKCYYSSWVFVCGMKASELMLSYNTVFSMLFLSMMKLCIEREYEGVYFLMKQGERKKLKALGWDIRLIKYRTLLHGCKLELLYLPANLNSIISIPTVLLDGLVNKQGMAMYKYNFIGHTQS